MKVPCWGLAVLVLFAAISCAQVAGGDIVAFDPTQAEVVEHEGRWKVICGDRWLIDFASNREEATRALEVIQYYGLNEQRFVGRPARALAFYTCSGEAPLGAMPGEDAIAFDPGNLEVRQVEGSWKIADGDAWLVEFGANEAAAREMLAEILQFGFDHVAFVGRPNASMTYFRASGASAPTPAPGQEGGAILRVRVVEGERAPASRPAVTLRPEGGANPVTLYENPARFDVPPGSYLVSARVGTGQESPPRLVEIVAGHPKDLTINTATGSLVLSLTAGGQPLLSCPNVALKTSAGPVAASSELPARFQAQEGEYFAEIEFAPSQVHRISGLRVTAGETLQTTAEVPCGTVTCSVVGSSDQHPYVELRNSAGLVAAQAANPVRFQVLAGQYEIGIRSGGQLLGARTLTLPPGASLEISLNP